MKPQAPRFDPFGTEACREIAQDLANHEGPLLPILHALQERFGYIDPAALPVIADVLNLSRAEVHGVVTFYHDFRSRPPGRHVVKICRAEACQALGAQKLFDEVAAASAENGAVTVEAVYCLGNCALSPAALIDGDLHGRLDTTRTLDLVAGR